VKTALRRLPGFAIALLALALSASLAFAGQPAGSAAPLTKASTHAGRTVPVQAGADTQGADEDTDTETEPDETDATDTTDETDQTESDSADNCLTDPTGLTDEELAAMSHGSIVCWAAQQTSWDTTLYKNHGAFVSHWAKTGHKGADATTRQHGKSANH
jgi:hypothetical protein